MNFSRRTRIGILLLTALIGVVVWSRRASKKKQVPAAIKTEAPARRDIIDKLVISGSLVPHKEAPLKTQMSGVLDKFYVAVGDQVKPGTPIARLKALPTSKAVEDAEQSLRQAQRDLEIEEAKYHRYKKLFEKKMLALEAYEMIEREWSRAGEKVTDAQKNLDFVLKGQIAGAKGASNVITSTISGIVAELSCEEGSIVTPYSSYNEGKPIATISDMSKILFQGKVGEMEVAQLRKGMKFEVSLNAVKGKKFTTTLTKVAPKAAKSDKGGSIKFDIEGTVQLNAADKAIIRAGYTALADIILEQAHDVLAIQEKCLHQEKEQEGAAEAGSSFVWVYQNKEKVKKPVKLGVSDGIYVEVKEGLTEQDQVIVADDTH